jgi:hypothetical protein
MEVILKEDKIQLYVENRYFIIPDDVEIYEINLPQLFEVIYTKLIKKEYTLELHSRYLTLHFEFNVRKKLYTKELICDEIFPYSNINITEETTRDDILKCIQCLRNKNANFSAIINDLEEELYDPEKNENY